MKKQALALWPPLWPKPKAEKPVLVKVDIWNQEEEVFRLVHQNKQEHPREQVQRLIPGMDLKRWMY